MDRSTLPQPIPSLLTADDFSQFRYKQQVMVRLRQAIVYPTGAPPHGAVRLRVTVAHDGQLLSASCAGTGTPVFEEAAMTGVSEAVPFPPFPREIPHAELTYEFLVAFREGSDPSISP